MSQAVAKDVAKMLAGLSRLVALARAIPEDILAAWLVYDVGLSKTHARNVAQSLKKLSKILEGVTADE